MFRSLPWILALLTISNVAESSSCAGLINGSLRTWGLSFPVLPREKSVQDLLSLDSHAAAKDLGIDFRFESGNLVVADRGRQLAQVKLSGALRSIQVKKKESLFRPYFLKADYYIAIVTENEIVPFILSPIGMTPIQLAELPNYVSDGIFSWRITKFKQNELDRAAPTDARALYMYEMVRSDQAMTTYSGMSYTEVLPLLRMLNMTADPTKLVGYEFRSPIGDATSAMDYHVVEAGHRGRYRPPTENELFDRTLNSLVAGRAPTYEGVDGVTAYHAFRAAFYDPNWFSTLQSRIIEESGGKVRLEETESHRFDFTIKGPAKYLVLKTESGEKGLTFEPYATPFSESESLRAE